MCDSVLHRHTVTPSHRHTVTPSQCDGVTVFFYRVGEPVSIKPYIFYRVGEPVSIKPYMKKISFQQAGAELGQAQP